MLMFNQNISVIEQKKKNQLYSVSYNVRNVRTRLVLMAFI